MPQRPNILFLFSDQHHAGVMGCAGHPDAQTPVLDALAADGVRCTNTFAQNPICTPSRVCYLSGQYAHNHGVYGLEGFPPAAPSLLEHFKDAGYRTGMAGKIHTPPGWLSPHCDFFQDAYGHEYLTTECGRACALGDLQGGEEDDYEAYLTAKGLADDRDDKYLQEWKALHGGSAASQGLDARPSRLPEDETVEAWTAAQAIRFLQEDDDRPFIFWMSLPRPHETYAPAQRFWDLYDEASLSLPPSADDDLADRHPTLQAQKASQLGEEPTWTIFEPRDYRSARRRVLHGYLGCVSQVDDAIGRVLRELDALGLRENTIIVYAADHGDFAGEHGIIEKAPGISSRAITRVPFIWSWPGHLPQGRVCDGLAESVDLFPTLCALAGVPHPAWADGLDITPLLRGDTDAMRAIAVTENPLSRAIHTTRYTLVHYPPAMNDGQEFGELFDHNTDPWERRNLYRDPAYASVVQALERQLLDWLIATTRIMSVLPPRPGHPMPQFDKDYYDRDGRMNWENRDALLEPGAAWRKNYL
jgi:choline-sulfatase/uncharacterized sulfatase